MEKDDSKIIQARGWSFRQFLLYLMPVLLVVVVFNGCASRQDYSRSSHVPMDIQLPAIEPVPDVLRPREHPVLTLILGQNEQ